MPKITVLPHATLCPEGAVIEDAPEGQTVLDVLLDHDIEVDHACEKSCACTTCHVIIRKGLTAWKNDRIGRRPTRPSMGLGSRLAPELSGSRCR